MLPDSPVSGPRFPLSSSIALSVLLFLSAIGLVLGEFQVILPLAIVLLGSIAVMLLALAFRKPLPTTSAFIIYFLPLIVYAVIYEPIHTLMAAINPTTVDAQLLRIDMWIFGTNPIVTLGSIAKPGLTDFTYLSYFSYYLGMPVLLILMFFRNPRSDFQKVLTAMTIAWYGALLTYLLFPALGPIRFIPDELPVLQGFLPTSAWIQSFLTANLTPVVRDCVPSMHTGVTLLTLYYAKRYQPKFFTLYLVPGLGLIFATMYLQQHYVIDVILGIIASFIIYVAVHYLYRERKQVDSNTQQVSE
jgi:PAP2 superfamily protein